jgi:hypothetical protein
MSTTRKRKDGLGLVEVLLALALMGFMAISISNFFIKSDVASRSTDMRFKEASEIHTLILDIQRDLQQGAYISDNSNRYRLEYTTYDSSGNAIKKIYRITTISAINYLQYSSDGGSTWESPYRISSNYAKYQLPVKPSFLYAQAENNCTAFSDDDSNGVWISSEGITYAAICPNPVASPLLSKPSQANKIVLSNFKFTTGTGSPEAIRNLPTTIFLKVGPSVVQSTASAVSPAVADPMTIQSFPTASTASLFSTTSTTFAVRGITWDPAREHMFLVGNNFNRIFMASRQGVIMDKFTTSIRSGGFRSIAMESDGHTVQVLDTSIVSNGTLYRFDLNNISNHIVRPLSTLTLGAAITTSPNAIAFDPSTPNDFYVAAFDPTDSNKGKIFQRNFTTGALVAAFILPPALSANANPRSFFIEPTTGDFIFTLANGTTLDIYRLTRAGIATLLWSQAQTPLNWGMTYDPTTNHIFLANGTSGSVSENSPPVIITPRN